MWDDFAVSCRAGKATVIIVGGDFLLHMAQIWLVCVYGTGARWGYNVRMYLDFL